MQKKVGKYTVKCKDGTFNRDTLESVIQEIRYHFQYSGKVGKIEVVRNGK